MIPSERSSARPVPRFVTVRCVSVENVAQLGILQRVVDAPGNLCLVLEQPLHNQVVPRPRSVG